MAAGGARDRQADRAAFLRIYEEYGPALARLAGAYAASRQDREDLVQEIAIALWRALPAYRGDASRRTWLYRIAHNVAISASVKRRHRERREGAHDNLPEVASAAAGAEQDLLAEEMREALLAAIRALPAADRQITVLHLEGLGGAEIASVTGIHEGAVATRLTRIRQKLRQAVRAREMGNA